MTVNPIPTAGLDLVFERFVALPAERIWAAWTTPDLLLQWFTPAPWRTIEAEIDLRPGGLFRTVMLSPEGQTYPNAGCYLDIEPNRRLVWTNALGPGFRPIAGQDFAGFAFTAKIELTPEAGGTRYTATVIHGDPQSCEQHRAMGFEEGWGKALDQLIACVGDR